MKSLRYYRQPRRVRGYTVPVTLVGLCDVRTAAKIIHHELPELSREAHLGMHERARRAAQRAKSAWARVADREMFALRGRPFQAVDYKVAGIGCSDFSPRGKEVLRRLARTASSLRAVADIHAHLAANHGRYARKVA